MPTGLERRNLTSGVHFITVSCFRRQPLLGTKPLRDRFQTILFETQSRYGFELKAWVIMPEHVHLLLRPEPASTATILQVLKQRYARQLKQSAPTLYLQIEIKTAHPPPMPVWEPRYHDRNLTTPEATQNVIDYIHHNPVKRGLTTHARDWPWSSYHQHQQPQTFNTSNNLA